MELYLPPIHEFYRYNPANGQFQKGHIPWNKGKKHRPETLKKLSRTWFKKGNISTRKYGTPQKNNKPVEMYFNGRLVGYFESIGIAEKKTGIWSSNIRKVIQGKRKMAGGFEWKTTNS